MIKFKRGSTKNWLATRTRLEAGQPGYDKEKHKLKIGDGYSLWSELPYASGLFSEEILNTEANAKTRKKKDAEDLTLITYGTEDPNKDTVGAVYLQQSENCGSADYVIHSGTDGIWTYRLWKSGIAECWGTTSVKAEVKTNVSQLFRSNKLAAVEYPTITTFKENPMEVATLAGVENAFTWLVGQKSNSKTASGEYFIMSTEKLTEKDFKITLHITGQYDPASLKLENKSEIGPFRPIDKIYIKTTDK